MQGSNTALRVTFEYTNRAARKGRKITVGPQRVYEMLAQDESIRVVGGLDVLEQWCEDNEVKVPETKRQKAKAVAAIERTAPKDTLDGWPAGVRYSRSGSYYTVKYKGAFRKIQGKAAAMEAAQEMVAGQDAA